MGGRGMWWESIKQLAPFMDCPERAKENSPRQRNVMLTKERHRMKTRRLCFDAPPHPALPVFWVRQKNSASSAGFFKARCSVRWREFNIMSNNA